MEKTIDSKVLPALEFLAMTQKHGELIYTTDGGVSVAVEYTILMGQLGSCPSVKIGHKWSVTIWKSKSVKILLSYKGTASELCDKISGAIEFINGI